MSRLFIIYDSRALSMPTDDSAVLCVADTLDEAISDAKGFGCSAVVYSYAKDEENSELSDERLVGWCDEKNKWRKPK